MPSNLRIAKFEHLASEVTDALAAVGIRSNAALPWRNRSEHRPFASYYDDEAERAVYLRTKWVFDRGYYERLRIERVAEVR